MQRALILDSERQAEMSVVRNEYEIGENNPARALQKALVATAIQAHPYHWDTIGYRSDIEGVTTEKLREHYRRSSIPTTARRSSPATSTSTPRSRSSIASSALPEAARPIPQVITVEPPQEGERRVVVKRPGTTRSSPRVPAARRVAPRLLRASRCSPRCSATASMRGSTRRSSSAAWRRR
jgi:zinc protease